MQELLLSTRFNGPPDSANGGYTCGRLAEALDSPCVQITLRLPPPLEESMELRHSDGKVELLSDGKLVAEAVSAALDLEIPEPPTFAQAQEATQRYIGHQHHPFPTCFVCGPARDDGLRIFAGALGERVAATWTPVAVLGDEEGHVRPEYMWCALDCPGAFSVDQGMENPRVLGRLVGQLYHPLPVGKPAVVLGWPLGFERRKAFAGTAIFDAEGQLCAAAKATWIALS
jgi:hypothetical protein